MKEKLTKEEYFNLDNGVVQDITRKFIHPHIFRNQHTLVNDMFDPDEIENLYMTDKEILENMGSYDEDVPDQLFIDEYYDDILDQANVLSKNTSLNEHSIPYL